MAISDSATARQVDAALQRQYPGGFDIATVSGREEARDAVLDRTAVAGFVGSPRAELFVAQGNGASLAQALTKDFTTVAAGQGRQLTVHDVAPTESKDPMGTTVVYFGIAWSVPGYILATTLLRAVTFDRRRKLLSIAGVAALFAIVGFLVGVGLGYFPNDPAIMAIAFLLTTSVATFASGLAPFARHFFPALGMGLFIVLSIPTSGGVAPAPLLPPFFHYAHAVMPLANAVDALRGVLYFDGAGLLKPVLVLCAWITAGVVLLGLDAWRHHHKASRRQSAAREDVAEPPMDDPSVETPTPTALPVHARHFGETVPDLTGTVCDAEQRPIHRASVTVMDTSGRQLVSTTTNAQGHYAIAGLQEGYLSIVVTSVGRNPAVHQRELRSGAVVRADFALHERVGTPSPTAMA
ncbi:carboxypeptidase regulatory-like domain-containing protein [Streptomyces sp. NBC_00841]|uniref:carboxypeptidase regulatory-like domain-containing protein n=1 Tax=unclassified Streptomyces TaxID=2593676 RepID=UPI00225652B8|nr:MULTISPECIES: carboxypeptidase regulatory-like domain-containing protein [unclassified Streptomyces]MCX4537242.1 carboxypeptidase regulatory-like domain-containing protein [Streptomyces sp. NBC_01669]WRZ97528.1 carboxypeptidase regulatory-like domain-containing protein [Streptomyces sp. NBC_00841]